MLLKLYRERKLDSKLLKRPTGYPARQKRTGILETVKESRKALMFQVRPGEVKGNRGQNRQNRERLWE